MIAPVTTAPARPVAPPPTANVAVRVTGLTKTFALRRSWSEILRPPWRAAPRTTVVNAASFDVPASSFFGLLGANGAGKTTIFKMLAAQLIPDGGTATIHGFDIVRQPHRVRQLLTPVTPDERSLHWRLTATENLQLFATLYGLTGAAAQARVHELLQVVELNNAGTRLVATFSSGMKQRLLIARALMPRPRVLLLDEPTRSLDPLSARRFRSFLREEIVGAQGCTVLLATHNAEEAFELCDTVAVLDRGRLLAHGSVAELKSAVSDDRYRLRARASQHDALLRVLPAARMVDQRAPGERTDWLDFEIGIAGGPDQAAAVLAELTRAGIAVSQFERADISLADLIERVVQRKGRSTDA